MKFKKVLAALAALCLLPMSCLAAMAEGEDDAAAEAIPDVPESERVVLFQSDFDDKAVGKWNSFGGDPNLSISDVGHDSPYSLRVTDRIATWQGPSVTCDFITAGDKYYFDGWVYQDTGEIKSISWTLKYTDALGLSQFVQIDTSDVESESWVNLNGSVEVPAEATAIDFYFECSNATSDFCVDDVVVMGRAKDGSGQGADNPSGSSSDLIKCYDFENDKEGWNTRGDESLVHTDEYSFSGEHSIYSTGRDKCWNGPSVNVNEIVQRDKEYYFSAYIMYNGKDYENEHNFLLELEYTLDGSVNYMLISDKAVPKGKWTEIADFYTIPAGAENIRLYAQTANAEDGAELTKNDLMSFYVDKVSIYDGAYIRKKMAAKKTITIIISAIILAAAAAVIFFIIKNIRKNSKALEAAARDAMTHALNRNSYEERINEMKEDPEKCKGLYYALCDVNFLKYINDNFGHKSGDDAIIRCAKLLIEAVGYDGDVYRTGGDEFICISRKPIQEKITQATAVESAQDKGYPFAVASGFAVYDKELDTDKPDITAIIARCDKAMYEHKQQIKAENQEYSRS